MKETSISKSMIDCILFSAYLGPEYNSVANIALWAKVDIPSQIL